MTNEKVKKEIESVTNKEEPTETKEVATIESNAIAALGLTNELAAFKMEEGDNWGAGADLDENKELFVNDYLIPKIQLVQALSQYRIDGVRTEGEYANSINGKLLSNGLEEDLDFVVVNTFKRWHTFSINEKMKREFISSETMTLENANYKYEFKKDGIPHVRRQVLSYTVLLARDLQNGITRPYVLDFAGFSKRAGRVLITEINEVRDAGYPSAVLLFALSCKMEKNDDGTFGVKLVTKKGATSKEVVMKAKEVYKDLQIHKDQIIVDESDLLKKDPQVLPASDEV